MSSNEQQLLGVGSWVRHPAYGEGVVTGLRYNQYEVSFKLYGIKEIGKNYAAWEVLHHEYANDTMTFTEAEKSLINILKKWADITEPVALGDKWKGGKMLLCAEDKSLKPKEIPIETFFHKIVMTRDRLRVMEQRINASDLTPEEKVNLQQYITRIYGSLTSFNDLFKFKEDRFIGEKSE
jgi:hypothetical protein